MAHSRTLELAGLAVMSGLTIIERLGLVPFRERLPDLMLVAFTIFSFVIYVFVWVTAILVLWDITGGRSSTSEEEGPQEEGSLLDSNKEKKA